MTPHAIQIACCQLNPLFGDVNGNVQRSVDLLSQAARRGARLAVLPELANTGYAFRDRAEAWRLAEPLCGHSVTAWQHAADTLGLIVAAGFCEAGEDGKLYNSAVLVVPEAEPTFYRKVHLWDAEKVVFDSGSMPPPVIDTAIGRLGLLICYDLEIPEWVRLPALAGTDVLCVPVNWPLLAHPPHEVQPEVTKAKANAAFNRMAVAVCDRSGVERGVTWAGQSLIADANGYTLASAAGAPNRETCIVLAALDVHASRNKYISRHNHVFADRQPALYQDAYSSSAPFPRARTTSCS